MSHSPSEGTGATKEYIEGWSAIYELVRQGKSWSGRERHVTWLNTQDGEFADISAISGLDFLDDGRGLAVTDWDLDGTLDLWITNRSDIRLRFLHNRGSAPQSFVAFRLRGTRSNRDAIGATVELRLADTSRPRRVKALAAGDGYLAQSSKWVHFGLGRSAEIEAVEVRWPNGTKESFGAVEALGRYLLEEGIGTARSLEAHSSPIDFGRAAPLSVPPTSRGRTVLVNRLHLALPEVLDEDAAPQALAPGTPRLINLWASWCPNCRRELTDFAQARAALGKEDLEIWALSVDEEGTREAATEFLDRLSWPYDQALATPGMLTLLDAVQQVVHTQHGGMVLPTSFLLDRDGDVAVIYRGPLSSETLLADLALLDAPAEKIRQAATPFTGRWATGPGGNATFDLAARLASQGDAIRGWAYLRDEQIVDQAPLTARQQAADAFDRVALALAEKGLTAESVDARKRAVAMLPTAPRYRAFGNVLTKMGRAQEGMDSLMRAAELDPSDGSIALDLGLALAGGGDLAAARKRFESVLDLAAFGTDAHCKALHNIAVTEGQGNGGDTERAIGSAERALACDDSSFQGWMYLGVLRHRHGAFDGAVDAYRRALALDSTNARLIFYLGRALIEVGDLVAATAQAELLEKMGKRQSLNLRREIARRQAGEAER